MAFYAQIRKSLSFLFGEPWTSSSSQKPGHNHREQIWMASQGHFLPFLSTFVESWLSRSELAQWKHRLIPRAELSQQSHFFLHQEAPMAELDGRSPPWSHLAPVNHAQHNSGVPQASIFSFPLFAHSSLFILLINFIRLILKIISK